jgi:hypothetical protein
MTFLDWAAANSHDLDALAPEQVTMLRAEWRAAIRSQGEAVEPAPVDAVPSAGHPIHYVGGPDGQPPLMC